MKSLLVVITFTVLSFNSFSQLGNIKNIKDKVKAQDNKSSSTTPSKENNSKDANSKQETTTNSSSKPATSSSNKEKEAEENSKVDFYFSQKMGNVYELSKGETYLDNPSIVPSKYEEIAKSFNASEVLQKIKEGKGYDKARQKEIESFINNYEQATFNKTISPSVNALINKAYIDLKKNNFKIALVYAQNALSYTNGALLINSTGASIKDLQKEAQDCSNAVMAKVGKDLFASPEHAKNINKIVFYDKPVKIGQESTATPRISFKAGENIYAIIYFDEKLSSIASLGAIDMKLYINGNLENGDPYKYNQADANKTYIETCFYNNEPTSKPNREAKSIVYWLDELAPRKNKIKISYGTASGEFEMDCSGDGADKLAAISKKFHDYDATVAFENTELPKMVRKDPVIEKIAMEYHAKNHPEITVKNTYISSDWLINKKSTGIITSREVWVVINGKNAQGECVFYLIEVCESYSGGGTYGSPHSCSSTHITPAKIKCEKMGIK